MHLAIGMNDKTAIQSTISLSDSRGGASSIRTLALFSCVCVLLGQSLFAATAAAGISSDLDPTSPPTDTSRLHLGIILFSRLLQGYCIELPSPRKSISVATFLLGLPWLMGGCCSVGGVSFPLLRSGFIVKWLTKESEIAVALTVAMLLSRFVRLLSLALSFSLVLTLCHGTRA